MTQEVANIKDENWLSQPETIRIRKIYADVGSKENFMHYKKARYGISQYA